MSINIGPAESDDELKPRITVIGVGGAGGNAIANMIDAGIEGVEFLVANTDAQALSNSATDARIQLGPDITGGLGAGARPEVGKAAAEETVAELEKALEGVNMCFIAAGMGGGTGTGAAPVIAEAARRMGVLTVGVVTKPFLFEGTRRMKAAESGIEELQKHVDTLIVIPNQNLFLVAKAETTFKEAFMLADEVLQQGVRSITDLMVMPGLINLDFADVRSVMSEMGKAMMGTGEAEGESRALQAAEQAIANPLLDGVSMAGAKGVIISIIGGEDMRLLEVDEAANHIRELVDDDANIIWGSAFNPDLEGKIRVSVVATGIDHTAVPGEATARPFTLSGGRVPKRPALDLSMEQETVADDEPLELGAAAEAGAGDGEGRDVLADNERGSFGLGSAEDYTDEGDEFDDVDDIVDPLAGLRNHADEEFDESDRLSPPADDSGHASGVAAPGFGNGEPGGERDTLDLDGMGQIADADGGSDELLLGSDEMDESDGLLQSKQPGRRRGILGGGSGAVGGGEGPAAGAGGPPAGSSGQGSTLFERMANLSRGSTPSDDEDDDDDDSSSSLSIPRFLGRQNNQ
ncbi:cell division protein FtsZ [Qipengyuania oceanensis]|uniref:Cell division protein FtsZ n=1 Tax=Qipengyuania oceanensis TaxID=1463597 RepID=A0A844YCW8_9SPHN|nr:cell division protein FtsZ [Qipengyuania oceanensis]MXO62370.1 cell division protein FtsZ [Qipengyuania oceanensis]